MQAGEMRLEQGFERAVPDEDERLLRSAADESQAAFEALVVRHSGRVASVVSRFLENREDVQDAVQETFLRAYQQRKRYRGEAGVRAWLLGIAVNVCRNRRREFWRWRTFLSREGQAHVPQGPDAQELAESRLARGELERLLDRLPDDLRIAFSLRFLEELSGVEIAAILRIPESTVWTRIYAARRELRKQLAGSEGEL